MEFVEGTPLKGPVPVADALRLAGQIAGALTSAHSKGTRWPALAKMMNLPAAVP
jgi:hypothetical protein